MALRDLGYIFIKRIALIIILTVVFIGAAWSVSTYLLTPLYESSTQLIINKSPEDAAKNDLNYNDILLTQKLVKTYSIIISSDSVITKVIHNLQLDMRADELKRNLKVSGVNDTEIIKISVTDTMPQRAADIANAFIKVIPEEIIRTVKAGSVEIIDPASVPEKPVFPNLTLNMVVAGLVGFLLGLFIAIIIEKADKTIKTEDDVTNILKITVVGVLPKVK